MWVLIIRQQYLRGAPCLLEYLRGPKGVVAKARMFLVNWFYNVLSSLGRLMIADL